jgi:Rieske Fe-S protein
MAGLAFAAEKAGVRIYTSTHIKNFEKNGDEGMKLITANDNIIMCKDVVMATNTPVSDKVFIHTKQAPYTTYVVALKIAKNSVPTALYWDNAEPYHYVRLQPEKDYDVLIAGGEDHKTGQAEDQFERYKKLEEWTQERFPQAQEVLYRWSGQVMEPHDGLSYTGPEPEFQKHVYIITADSGMGMTHGTYSAMLIKDMITGKYNEWAKIYDPARITLSAAGNFIKETANMAIQYLDLLTGGDVSAFDEITPGEGAVMRSGLKKIAVYKDHEGRVFGMNALCTHLKCVVHWNKNEKTWDCPCHGSRFDALGKVIKGPAMNDLERIKSEEIAEKNKL